VFKSALLSFVASVKASAATYTLYGSLITVLAYIYGMISTPLFWVLIIFSFIDYLHGTYAAWKNKELDWDIALEGIIKKFYIGVLIVLSALIDFTLAFLGINTMGLFHNFIMAALLGRELGSIIRNAKRAGLWVPKILKDAQELLSKYGKGK
jgi:toxin secretion/phage lysis holin